MNNDNSFEKDQETNSTVGEPCGDSTNDQPFSQNQEASPVENSAPVMPEAVPVSETTGEAAPVVEKTAAEPEVTPAQSAENGISNVTYHPQSDTYSYQKNAHTTTEANGCAWDSTTVASHPKPKAKASSRGFKVFAACMLSVFTISAVAIASFMAVDFVDAHGSDKATVQKSEPASSTDNSQQNSAAILLSTFKDSGEGLTKAQVATKCGPSTVGIVVESQSTANSFYGFFGNYYSQPQIVQGVGSGFIYNKDGYIITNHHVVEDATKITVYLNDDTQVEATLVGSDELSDLAVIKVDPTDLELIPMEIGDSERLVVGDEVIAIGCPAGIQFRGTVTDGIISAINRNVELSDSSTSGKKTMTLLQTNATINKGNSGGPLINSNGQVIGINTLKLTSEYEGIGFAIPINGAVPIISQLIEFGKVTERPENDFVSGEGVIGISGSNITASESEYYDIPQGVLVVQINKDGAAAKAGLRRGDIITAYNGKEVKTITELNTLKASNKAGDEVTITVYRDSDEDLSNKTFDLTFKLDMAS